MTNTKIRATLNTTRYRTEPVYVQEIVTVKEYQMIKKPLYTAYLCKNSPEKPRIAHNCPKSPKIAQNRAVGATLVNGYFRPKTPRALLVNGVFTEIFGRFSTSHVAFFFVAVPHLTLGIP
jgi:hypothetical protein